MSGAPPVAAVDVGGTHTDALVWDGAQLVRGKALTTPHDFSEGVLNALESATTQLEIGVDELLPRLHRFVNGTTIVTNALTELRGARVGAIVTRGFRDMFRIANGPRQNIYDDHRQLNVPDIVAPDCIAEVTERVDYAAAELIPLDEAEAAAAIDQLVEERGVEALAVGFLWSFKHPAHERRVGEIAAKRHPDVPVFLSHDVYPMMGAYERWMTTVLNAFVSHRTSEYMDSLETKLTERGLSPRALSFLHGLGGIVNRGEVNRAPLVLWQSGPAGGVTGTNSLGLTMEVENLIAADMGGTSLDVSVIAENTVSIERHRSLQPWDMQTGVSLIDVVSIAAREISGSRSVGNTASATRRVRCPSRFHPPNSASPPVRARNEPAVAASSSLRTSRADGASVGVQEATGRGSRGTPRSSSRMMRSGIRLTR